MEVKEEKDRLFLIRMRDEWWIKARSENEAVLHLVNVICRDRFLDEHHPAFQCVSIRSVDES
ncbi:MAG: hypothetical protein KAX49_14030 [Halanaerobiales bacterium]|nr:hypothetical protein [Halanaerobiales bacterium]